ncbi:MAG: hypothetical protein MUF06_00810, partial [Pirellulaceae bacterium]|nr:hypothetical protein [Pirellulaceae bacterium]
MRCASALSTREEAAAALQEICHAAREQVGGSVDLAVLFVSQAYGDAEQIAAQALWVAHWPGVETSAFHLQFERTREGGVIQGWPDQLAGEWPEGTFLLLLGEPFSFPADLLLDRLNEDRPGIPVIGGMASGGAEPGENRLFLGRQTLAEGCVAVLVSGPIRLRTVVSQGCRPIGRHFVVTKAERNIIYELGGKPALLQLKEIFDKLPTREQVL